MARAKLTSIQEDLIGDPGTVLWSLVQGEQLEYPIQLNFINDVTAGYQFEAVVIEADNILGQTGLPSTIKPGGRQTVIAVRLPVFKSTWSAGTAYDQEDVVYYNNVYYKLLSGTARVNATPPDSDSFWTITTMNTLYIQFPSSLGSTYEIQPSMSEAIYGFFELRVTETNNPVFANTWKPVRGAVEILFSPTELVP